MEFHLSPPEPLGADERMDRGRSLQRPARIVFDGSDPTEMSVNTFNGRISAVALPMGRVTLHTDYLGASVVLDGHILRMRFLAESREQLVLLARNVYYGLPPLLGIEFVDPFTVTWVGGNVDGIDFEWSTKESAPELDSITATRQAERFERALGWLASPSANESKRLVAALQYFHRALLLGASGDTPWDFSGEALLNFNKCLEALFTAQSTPNRDAGSHDQVREQLRLLDCKPEEVETLIAVMKLRDEFDVGHVNIWPHDPEHLRAVFRLLLDVEPLFRRLLRRLLESIEAGTYALLPDDTLPRWSNSVRTLAYVADQLPPSGVDPQRLSYGPIAKPTTPDEQA